MTTPKPSATKSVVKGLADFLKANMPSIQTAYYGWPSPNEKLIMPALSVMAKIPDFSGHAPHTIWKGTPNPDTNEIAFRRAVGRWDFSLQVDLWSGYKPQRDFLAEEFINAFVLDPLVHGINLQLTDYFDEWATYTLTQVTPIDSEEGSQRNEWRSTATVLASCRAVREYSGHVIKVIENTLEIQKQIDLEDEVSEGPIV